MLKKTLLNFLMIQTTMVLIGANLGFQFGPFTTTGIPVAMAFFNLIIFVYSFIPSVVVAFTFAAIQKRFYEKR